MAPITAAGSSAASASRATSTHHTPSGWPSSAPAATCKARRVLPQPPAPVSVNSRTPPSSSPTWASSRRRPTKLVSSPGRLVVGMLSERNAVPALSCRQHPLGFFPTSAAGRSGRTLAIVSILKPRRLRFPRNSDGPHPIQRVGRAAMGAWDRRRPRTVALRCRNRWRSAATVHRQLNLGGHHATSHHSFSGGHSGGRRSYSRGGRRSRCWHGIGVRHGTSDRRYWRPTNLRSPFYRSFAGLPPESGRWPIFVVATRRCQTAPPRT